MSLRFARCAQCGQHTPLPADHCAHCGAVLEGVPPIEQQGMYPAPVPEPPPPVLPVLGELTKPKAYLTGLAIGILPLVIAALVAGGGGVFVTGAALVLVLGIAALICFSTRRWRWVGYGLLTMACISPVVAFIGCLVSLSNAPL